MVRLQPHTVSRTLCASVWTTVILCACSFIRDRALIVGGFGGVKWQHQCSGQQQLDLIKRCLAVISLGLTHLRSTRGHFTLTADLYGWVRNWSSRLQIRAENARRGWWGEIHSGLFFCQLAQHGSCREPCTCMGTLSIGWCLLPPPGLLMASPVDVLTIWKQLVLCGGMPSARHVEAWEETV